MTNQNLTKAQLTIRANIGEVIRCLECASIKIVFIVNDRGALEGIISDGDIRRGLLQGLTLDSSALEIIQKNPLVVPPELGREFVLQLMIINKIQQVPVINEHRQIIGLHLWDEISVASELTNTMVIMAGGRGVRLQPFTADCPKPMLLVHNRPILEHILERAKLEGFRKFIFSINYLGHMIKEHFGDGSRFGVEIEYLNEERPLGTAGALSLIKDVIFEPFVVTNGDVLTDIKYADLLDFHIRNSASATMAVRTHEWQHPYGVVQIDGLKIVGFEEKPVAKTYINAGVYVLDPSALSYLDSNVPCDMPILFERLRENCKNAYAYPMHEPWIDIGRPNDLELANSRIQAK